MAASMADHSAAPLPRAAKVDSDDSDQMPPVVDAAPIALPPVLTGRAQMEQERLERQRVREASNGRSSGTATNVVSTSSARPVQPPPAVPVQVKTMADLNRSSSGEVAGSASGSRPIPVNGATSNGARAKKSYHPLQSPGPFPTDAAGEYYLDGELRHVSLSIGSKTDSPTFSPHQVVGAVRSRLSTLKSTELTS